jgi:hypothetical protein
MERSEGAIYPPPKDGLPFLVVTFSNGTMHTQPAGSRSEARMLLARERTQRLKVVARDGEGIAPV